MASYKCEFCGNYVVDRETTCPYCGAANPHHKQTINNKRPHTIEELQQWYVDRGLPREEVTRFFIGKNIQEPKAFGIYQDGRNFIVYKNKADGSRAIRYQGPDESYAVNEIYLKLKEEIMRRKRRVVDESAASSKAFKQRTQRMYRNAFLKLYIMLTCCIAVAMFFIFSTKLGASSSWIKDGYYFGKQDEIFYKIANKSGDDWWLFDTDSDSWSLYVTLDKNEKFKIISTGLWCLP